jgi:hypothetical protein
MDPNTFLEGLAKSAEFLLAFGSIIGLLGIVIGFILIIFLGKYSRKYAVIIVFFSIVLLVVCGPRTGIEYFQIGF